MKHEIEIMQELDITGRGHVLVVNEFPNTFNVGDVINNKWEVRSIEGAWVLIHPPKHKRGCGLVVKEHVKII